MSRSKAERRSIATWIGFLLILLLGNFLLGSFFNIEGSGSGDFNTYRGPVLPMTSLNGAEGVDVTRKVDFDFSPYQGQAEYGILTEGAAGITDTYSLTNTTNDTKTLELVYGFQGQFIDEREEFPSIAVDGQEIEPVLYPSVDTGELIRHTHNFEHFSQTLGENDFLGIAMEKPDKLDIPVTAYHFTDLAYEGTEVASYPMLTLQYSIDENTTVWTNIVDSIGTTDDGKHRLMIRVDRAEGWIYTQGGTLIDLEFGGNKGYNTNENSSIEVKFQVETYETTLDDVIRLHAQNYDYWAIHGQESYPNPGCVTPEILAEGTIKRIHEKGFLEPSDRIRLISELFQETITEPRMMYMVFPVTLEPGRSATVDASYIQEPSYDINGPKQYREGYELATKLGSDLHFTALGSSLSNTEAITLGKQNFGFDLDKGITEVNLDLNVERYYLEVIIKK